MAFFTRSLQDLSRITVNDVHRIIQATSKTPASKKDKGFKLYVSSYIHNYEVSNKQSGEVMVRSECFRSMRKSQKPHCLSVRESHPAGSVQVQKKRVPVCQNQVSIVLRDSKPVVLLRCQCTCVAGTALCCHVAALLYQTAHYSQLRLSSVPPVFSCTETEQKWHKPRTMGIKPGPVNDMVIISARPRERRLVEGIRSNLYKGASCPLPDISTLKVQEAYHGLSADEAPMITTMAISSDLSLVESLFGPVQEGSVLSYQLPVRTVPSTRPHKDAPSPPQLPLFNYRPGPSACTFVLSEHQHHHLASPATSLETAHKIEKSTREQSACVEWHQLRRCRITSTKFREVCHTRAVSSAENLAKRLLGPCHHTADMRRGLALEPIAVEEYCKVREVNHYPCGFLIHPEAPWMGSTPDGIVYDPEGQPVFGLLEIKCPNVSSYVDCPCIMIKEGTHTLRRSHPYYWQVQGQMLISGCEWCDFVIYTEDDMFIQRIPRDIEVTQTIKEKVDYFFFLLLPQCLLGQLTT